MLKIASEKSVPRYSLIFTFHVPVLFLIFIFTVFFENKKTQKEAPKYTGPKFTNSPKPVVKNTMVLEATPASLHAFGL
jgi:hypothetical protein